MHTYIPAASGGLEVRQHHERKRVGVGFQLGFPIPVVPEFDQQSGFMQRATP